MDKKQYKIKIENGQIKFQEPIDLSKLKEGIVIFLDEEVGYFEKKLQAFESTFGLLKNINDKDVILFEDAMKRRPFFKENNG